MRLYDELNIYIFTTNGPNFLDADNIVSMTVGRPKPKKMLYIMSRKMMMMMMM